MTAASAGASRGAVLCKIRIMFVLSYCGPDSLMPSKLFDPANFPKPKVAPEYNWGIDGAATGFG
jgi:hypothetical protein